MQSSAHHSGIYRMRDRSKARQAGMQAGTQMSADARRRGEVGKLHSCEAARTGGRTGGAGGRDGEARKRPRKEP
jgi:hypothetical protein